MNRIKVRFIEKTSGELDGFELHTAAGHPIHERVSRALERLNLRIARRDTCTDASGSRQRVSIVSKDGTPIHAATRLQLQALLLRSASLKPRLFDRGGVFDDGACSGPEPSSEH